MYYFKGNQKIHSQISKLYISNQIFCRMMTFQSLASSERHLKLCIKLNYTDFTAKSVLRVFLFI